MWMRDGVYALNVMIKRITNEEIEFLSQSNAIEREYSTKALEDACGAWKYAKTLKYITIDGILKIHKILMKHLNKRIAGKIRNCPVYIGGEKKSQSKEEIECDLQWWVSSYAKRGDEEGIKTSHILFEKIHPFEDGNGRTGRILMNLQRIQAHLPILIIHEGEEQFAYYGWFKK